MQETDTVIVDILRRRLPYAAVVDTFDGVPLADLGLDSMTAIDLVLDIEAALDVMFSDDVLVAETFETATSLQAVVDRLRAEAL